MIKASTWRAAETQYICGRYWSIKALMKNNNYKTMKKDMKNKDPLVSIIVPVYGTEAYLPACIESLCRQTYSNIEIILVDDQSPDGCPEICDSYAGKDSRIRVIHQKNKGVSGARNTGMDHVSGYYVMFVDSDDELYPDSVELLLQDACKYDADIVSASAKIVGEDGQIVETVEEMDCEIFTDDKPLLLLLDEDPIGHVVWAKIFKSDFIKDIRFEEGKAIGEDGFFMFQCYIKNPRPLFVHHNVAVYQQNIRPGSSSRLRFSDKTLSMLYFFEKKKAYIIENLPKYTDNLYQAEVCVNLRLLDAMCSTDDKKYRPLQRRCIKTVCALRTYYKPINRHHEQLVWIASHGLYGIYKTLVRMKYYR